MMAVYTSNRSFKHLCDIVILIDGDAPVVRD
jgi:hypothetical protein